MLNKVFEFQDPAIVEIRRLRSFDRCAILNHFMRLDPASRRMRFGGGVSKQFVTQYASKMLDLDTVVYGAFVDEELRGLGELRSLPEANPASAEAAFTVETPFQNRGIGSALLRSIMVAAKLRRIKNLYMIWLPNNERMQQLALRYNAELQFEPLHTEATIHPNWPKITVIIKQLIDETKRYMNYSLNL